MMRLVRSEWERLWAKKVTWLCFLMIPVMLLGAAKYYLKHNQEVERIAVDYTYANSFPVLALSEMLMSICNLVLLVLIVLVFAQEYHSGQIRMIIQRSYTYSEVLIAKIITILAVSLLFIGAYFICSYCIGYIFFEHEPSILLFYHTEKMNALGIFLYCISYYGIAYLTLIAMASILIMLSAISKSTTSATLLGMGFIIFSFGYPAMALVIRKSPAFLYINYSSLIKLQHEGIAISLSGSSRMIFFGSVILLIYIVVCNTVTVYWIGKKDNFV
ncbi:ABC transporter permease subunit [Bacillus paramycoides]|uniref:ABC transporter permease subunit n=1 Tax=Bacillus paramycoides TaxID=2026194 RepID=UPI002E21D41E|nr:ABC transporter permease subunit [Bacillus paramycoides]MED0969945.1 ABC transporter permease subunit [Bacillus paramycoides]